MWFSTIMLVVLGCKKPESISWVSGIRFENDSRVFVFCSLGKAVDSFVLSLFNKIKLI